MPTKYRLALEWSRCPDGVEIVDHGDDDPHAEMDDAEYVRWSESSKRLQYRSARFEPVTILTDDLQDPLSVRFANARGDDRLLEFFSRYGLLLSSASRVSEKMKDDARQGRPASESKYIEMASDPYETARSIQETIRERLTGKRGPEAIRSAIEKAGGTSKRLSAEFEWAVHPRFDLVGKNAQLQLSLVGSILVSFLFLEIATIIVHGARVATCEHCGDIFLTGPLTGNRSHAKYHADKCRVAAMRKRNSTNGKQGDKS